MFCQKSSALYCAMAIFSVISLLLLYGCADREELTDARRQQAPGYNTEANEALKEAEAAMKEAGIDINFSELSGLESLADLRAILPDPMEIAQFEKQQKIEEAIDALYAVLEALGELDVSGAPVRVSINLGEISNSDLALIHLHLVYLYVLDAVSRLARAGIGPDGVPNTADDLYHIDFPEELEAEDREVYKFMLTDKGQELMDSVDPEVDPYGHIKVFYKEGQLEALQAILDSLLLLLGAEVVVLENPAEGIELHEPQVDTERLKYNALHHLEKALELAKKIAPQLEDALDELDETITELFSKEILEDAKDWGFEIRKVPERYEYLLE